MSLDLNTLLNEWPHEPGAIKVRKILGLDGREKLQLRIDLGMLQMEMTGRPDGAIGDRPTAAFNSVSARPAVSSSPACSRANGRSGPTELPIGATWSKPTA